MSEGINEEVIQGQPVSAWDGFLLNWGYESYKNNLPFTTEILRLYVTLTVGLLAGSVVWLSDSVMAGGFRIAVVACFLTALGLSLRGVYPYTGRDICLNDPRSIETHKAKALRHKCRWLFAASMGLFMGFACALAGLAVRFFG